MVGVNTAIADPRVRTTVFGVYSPLIWSACRERETVLEASMTTVEGR